MDVIGKILAQTDIETIFRSRRVCRKWRAYIGSMRFARILPKWINHLTILFTKKPQHMYLSRKDLTWEFIKKYIHESYFYMFSANPNITWEIVKANPTLPWSYNLMSKNPNITFDIVKANLDKKWNWSFLTSNANITLDIIKESRLAKWNKFVISHNPNITWEIIQANPDIPWDYSYFSGNPNITWDIVKANPDILWDYRKIVSTIGIGDDLAYIKYAQASLELLVYVLKN